MHHARLILAFFAAALLGVFAAACGTPAPKCSPANCTGCCDASDACQTGGIQSQCGSQGNVCMACGAGTSCEFGVCKQSSTSGGGGGSTGGGGGATGGGGGSTGGGTGGGATGGGTGGGSTGGGTGGGSTGGGGGATGGGTGGGDAGMPMFDAGIITLQDGGMVHPPTIPLTFMANCGAVSPCAGNEVASWVYSAGCVDDSAFSRLTALATQYGCGSSISNKNGAIAGSVVFDGTSVHRVVVGRINFTFSATGACASSQVCPLVSGLLPAGITGSCAVAGAACDCQLSVDIGENGSQTYTYDGGVATLGSGETFDSCIAGSTMRFRETDGGVPGVFSITK